MLTKEMKLFEMSDTVIINPKVMFDEILIEGIK
jgi:hypothetical protein